MLAIGRPYGRIGMTGKRQPADGVPAEVVDVNILAISDETQLSSIGREARLRIHARLGKQGLDPAGTIQPPDLPYLRRALASHIHEGSRRGKIELAAAGSGVGLDIL